jgi:hypothetical protein
MLNISNTAVALPGHMTSSLGCCLSCIGPGTSIFLDDRRIEVCFPGRLRDFSLLLSVQTGLVSARVSVLCAPVESWRRAGTGRCFSPRCKAAWAWSCTLTSVWHRAEAYVELHRRFPYICMLWHELLTLLLSCFVLEVLCLSTEAVICSTPPAVIIFKDSFHFISSFSCSFSFFLLFCSHWRTHIFFFPEVSN